MIPDETIPDAAAFAPPIAKWFPTTGVGRVRCGDLSLSVVRDSLHPVRMYLPGMMPVVLSARVAYFGAAGDFVVDRVDWNEDNAILYSDGNHDARRPGYEMPLGRAIDPSDFDASIPERFIRPMPLAAMQWRLSWSEDSLVCYFKTSLDLDGVLGHLAIDLPAVGQWQCDGQSTLCQSGQRLLLSDNAGRMQYKHWAIELGPGLASHQCLNLRDTPLPITYQTMGQPVRIVIPFATPFEHSFTLKWFN